MFESGTGDGSMSQTEYEMCGRKDLKKCNNQMSAGAYEGETDWRNEAKCRKEKHSHAGMTHIRI